jgi:hypothetical protein
MYTVPHVCPEPVFVAEGFAIERLKRQLLAMVGIKTAKPPDLSGEYARQIGRRKSYQILL